MRKAVVAAVFLVLAGGLLLAQMQTTQAPAGQLAPAAQPLKLPASPPGQTATQVGGKWVAPKPDAEPRYTGGKWIVVDYGRPILRGRKDIFGAGADYGKKVNAGAPVWRAGANVTTRLHTEVPLVLAGKTLAPGDYSLFVDLKPAAWTLIVSNQPYQQKYDPNNKTDTWGSYNYDPKFDIVRVPMKVTTTTPSVDQFTIDFVNMTDSGGTLAMRWETAMATAEFRVGQ
jgi:hypothetical protein